MNWTAETTTNHYVYRPATWPLIFLTNKFSIKKHSQKLHY